MPRNSTAKKTSASPSNGRSQGKLSLDTWAVALSLANLASRLARRDQNLPMVIALGSRKTTCGL